MKFAFCNEMFEGWAWERTCLEAARIGYDGIEVAPYTFGDDVRQVSTSERKSILHAARNAGLEIVGTHWLLVKPLGMGLFSKDEKTRRFTADYLLEQVDFCADIGGSVMTFGSPGQRSIPDGFDRALADDLLIRVLRRIGDRATERGVSFCLEPLPPSMTNVMETVAEAVRVAEKASHPAIGFMLDVKSICAETPEPAEVIRKYSGRFGHFHANDPNLRGPGFGKLDYVPIMRALTDAGYERFVSVEVFDFSPDPVTIVSRSLKYMKECMVHGDLKRGCKL